MSTSTERRRSGDRKEGRLLRRLPALNKFVPYIMPDRDDAQLFYEESFEVTELDRYLRKMRVEGYKGIGILHFMIAAYIRGVSMLPGVNRFVAGRRIYARNDIEIIMMVKRELSVNSTETAIKVHFKPTDTIIDVYNKMTKAIDEVKTADENNGTEDFAETMCNMPRPLLKLAIGILKLMDYFGWLPSSWLEVSPFHGSMIITDLGSLRVQPVYHHIYNFGTLPVFIAFGAKYHKYELDRHGQMVDNKYVDVKFTLDERICDGHYYSKFLQAYRYMVQHPDMLTNPPSRTIEDIR